MPAFFLRTVSYFAVLCACAHSAHAQYVASQLEEGVAFSHPQVMRNLEAKGYGIGFFLEAGESLIANDKLGGLKTFRPVQEALLREIEEYRKTHDGVGVDIRFFGKRLFDPDFLRTSLARFALVGVINRMDRAYTDPATCGEIRFVYRLAYNVLSQGENVFSRLPMTVNMVLRMRSKNHTDCAEIARRWQVARTLDTPKLTADALAADLLHPAFVTLEQRWRLEVNMQIVRWPAAVRPDFGGHVEYLFKVFDFDAAAGAFREATLENMIDRDRILKSKDLRAKFTEWFFQPETLRRFDAGTIVIPEEYLAKRAFSVAPGGQSRSFNRPFFEMFSDEQIEKALAGQSLRNIRSVDGFHRRASDITCIGCHQTRAIGGFHFMGRDPLLKYPGNSVFVPGSTHFFGDLPRRKDIVAAFALNQSPDFSRGFSSRPQESRSRELVGRGLYDGWGAHCFKGADASFASWTCAAGLRCQTLHDSRFEIGMGVCVPDGRLEIGDALERGVVTTRRFGDDRYKASDRTKNPDPGRYVTSPQSAEPGKSTGGFPAGSLRTKTCDNLPGQAVCGALPAAANGFNACVGSGKNFVVCLREFSAGVGLRGCDADNPCRDDYICAESYDANKGACVPPYFLFQFRVDGHPVGKAK